MTCYANFSILYIYGVQNSKFGVKLNKIPYSSTMGHISKRVRKISNYYAPLLCPPPFEKGGAYCFAHVGRYVCRSVGMSVSLNLVQLITQERFATEASNLVGL